MSSSSRSNPRTQKQVFFGALLASLSGMASAAPIPIAQSPLFEESAVAPLNLLVMSRDHTLYYEAYNDASDLNNDGRLDVGYQPSITYFGYFDSFKCYTYNDGEALFEPTRVTATKRCTGEWSGDFLNYVTTARIDALRKVLYGGSRVVDTTSGTVLARTHIPQDGHSFGKEYTSLADNGYLISDYTPLDEPIAGRRHLFASVTLLNSTDQAPLLRVLNNGVHRVWEWLSIERPVADTQCNRPNNTKTSCTFADSVVPYPGTPENEAAMDNLVAAYLTNANRFGEGQRPVQDTGSALAWDRTPENPFSTLNQDLFLMQVTGQINVPSTGTWEFSIDGDDAVELWVNNVRVVGWYEDHGRCNCDDYTGTINLSSGWRGFRIRMVENTGQSNFRVRWRRITTGTPPAFEDIPADRVRRSGNANVGQFFVQTYNLRPGAEAATMTDYRVHVAVCVDGLREDNCKAYRELDEDGNVVATTYKPTGLLHDYGEDRRMMFGLLTGSYMNNTQGGVLRKNVLPFVDFDVDGNQDLALSEVDLETGIYTDVPGIVRQLDGLRTVDFGGSHVYNTSCPALGWRALNNGECRMWGNPVAEMMYEGLRYFGGAGAGIYGYTNAGSRDNSLGLQQATWLDPYVAKADGGLGYIQCAKPFMTVISDVNPSYDGQLPGSEFGEPPSGTTPTGLVDLDVSEEADAIWDLEFGGSKRVYIGESAGVFDGAPTVKMVTGFSDIRGLAPEEPTKGGTYHAASIARYGFLNDIRPTVDGTQNVQTFAIALASPLPRIEFPVGDGLVTLVPFAKSIAHPGRGATDNFRIPQTGEFRPTNTIVDFYVEQLVNTNPGNIDTSYNEGRPFARFRINYEDVEQGNDHDMDAIVTYTLTVNANDTLTIHLSSDYAAGSVMHHMGYVISGTTRDGIYLEVRDQDGNSTNTDNTQVTRYKFDTPPGVAAGGCDTPDPLASCPRAADNTLLPLIASRTFSPGVTEGAEILRDPLWFAAKHGSYFDRNGNGIPDDEIIGDGGTVIPSEWDEDGDGDPDNYFLVTNALGLKERLAKAFAVLLQRSRPAGSVATSSTRLDTDTLAYRAEYDSTDWTGDLKAFTLNADGSSGETPVWSATSRVPGEATRKIFSFDAEAGEGIEFTGDELTDEMLELVSDDPDLAEQIVSYVRGNVTLEERSGGPFRNRRSLIGDIINSSPVVAAKQDFGFCSFPKFGPACPQCEPGDATCLAGAGGVDAANSYLKFLIVKQTAKPLVAVGANAGMLHVFDATAAGGQELFGFVPSSVLSNLHLLTDPTYLHHYFVDGSPFISDVYMDDKFSTVLVGSTGAGGRSVFAIDISPGTTFSADSVLWEFTDPELGVSIGQPKIAAMQIGDERKFVAVFGNGYNSVNHESVLFIVDLETGDLIRKISTGVGTVENSNGLAGPLLVDYGGFFATGTFDGLADRAYAGDHLGNMWIFDLSSDDPDDWDVALSGQPLFVATDAAGARQPITSAPDAIFHPLNGTLVLFGTGRFFAVGDNALNPSDPRNSFYAIWDRNARVTGRAVLVERDLGVASAANLRQVGGETAINWNVDRGWFVDFDGLIALAGERVVSSPVTRFGRVFFNTYAPLGNECDPSGTGFLMVLDPLTGRGSLNLQTGSGSDSIRDPLLGGQQLPDGAPPGSPVLIAGDGTLISLQHAGSTVFDRIQGRQSWKQLR